MWKNNFSMSNVGQPKPLFNTKTRIYSVEILVQYFLEKFGGLQGFCHSDLDGPVDGVLEGTIPL